jgi:hypothetical protein
MAGRQLAPLVLSENESSSSTDECAGVDPTTLGITQKG